MSANVSSGWTVYWTPLTGRMLRSTPGITVSGSWMPLLDRIVSTSTPKVSAMLFSVSPGWTS